jgi:Ca2+-binding EF-hand superfamily protein
MGNTQGNRLTKEEIDDLHTSSHFDQKELKDLYKQFKKEIPSGGINKRDFKELLKGLGVVDVFLQDLIFNTFDYDKDGQINFKDVTTGLSIIARGDPDEKLELAFRLYDLDGNGVISREEMSQVIESYYKLVGPLISSSGKKYETPEQLVDEFFEQMDQNGDGVISLEEYKEGAMKNPDIIQRLKLFTAL